MNVAHHGHGGRDVDDIALFHEQFLCFGAYRLNQRFGQELLAIKLFDALVEIDARWNTVSHTRSIVRNKRHIVQGRPGIAAGGVVRPVAGKAKGRKERR